MNYQDNYQASEVDEQLRIKLSIAINSQYGSMTSFCELNGFDRPDLSKFLAGKKDWRFKKVLHLLCCLNARFEVGIADDTGREQIAVYKEFRMSTELHYYMTKARS